MAYQYARAEEFSFIHPPQDSFGADALVAGAEYHALAHSIRRRRLRNAKRRARAAAHPGEPARRRAAPPPKRWSEPIDNVSKAGFGRLNWRGWPLPVIALQAA